MGVVTPVENNTSNNSKMKSMLLVALFVAVAAAYPQELTVEYKEPIAITKYGSVSDDRQILVQLRSRQRYQDDRGGGTNTSVTSSKKVTVALPADLTLTNWKELPTPSTGLLMRTDSSPLVIICPLLPPCPSTSSRCWLT